MSAETWELAGAILGSAGACSWLAWEAGREKGRAEGRAQAEREARARALEALRRVTGGEADGEGAPGGGWIRERARGAWQVARAFLACDIN